MEEQQPAALRLEQVGKWYSGSVHAVQGVDLQVNPGEFLVFVGPSGCGKSTTLRMIAGLERVDEGMIYLDDQPLNGVAPKKRDMAMVFQNYALYPTMDVWHNLAFPLKMRRWPKEAIRQRVEEIAESLELTEFLQRRPGALSGGQRQRVALGRAMVRSPRLFLMDEPLSNLDAKLRVQMRREITTLQRQLGTTTIYVTHDQTEAMTMGDRIAIFNQGVLQQADTPQMVYDRPANQFVAQFIGSPPMNLWEQDGMILGVRPEHLRWTQEPGGLAAEVHTVERTGRETFVFGQAERIGAFAMVSGQSCILEPHSRGWLTVSAAHVHRFHMETGKRLNDPGAANK